VCAACGIATHVPVVIAGPSPVEAAVLSQDIGSQRARQGREPRAAGGGEFPAQDVCVRYRYSKGGELPFHPGFAAGDAAGQADFQHGFNADR